MQVHEGEVLKSYLKSQRISVQHIAELAKVSRQTVYQYFDTKILSLDTKEKIEKVLDVSFTKMAKEYTDSINTIGEKEPFYKVRQRKKIQQSIFMVPMVPVKARAGYVKSYDQVDYLSGDLEQYTLPPGVDPRGAVWRYFEVGGDSMDPVLVSGDIILASMVQHDDWSHVKNYHVHIILTKDQLLIKRVFRKSPDRWILISENEAEYAQQAIDVSEIKEVWVPRRLINSRMPPTKKFEIKAG